MSEIVVGLAEIVLWSRSLDRSLAFYGDIFGLEQISPDAVAPRFLRCGDGPGGIPQMLVLVPHPDPDGNFPAEKAARPLHHLAFNLPPGRFEAARSRCVEAGLEVRDGIHPVLKDVRTFYVDDPDGNEVECISPVTAD